MTEETILRAVMKDLMLGALEVDLEVPDHLKGKFAEMSPVFKNTHVSRYDIGDHMKTYAEERGIMNQKRKCLHKVSACLSQRLSLLDLLSSDVPSHIPTSASLDSHCPGCTVSFPGFSGTVFPSSGLSLPSLVCRGSDVGYDANALYLWSILQEMPTGHFVRRKSENQFQTL
jgi:hypothetical protein